MIHSKGKLLLRSAALIALLVAALGILSVLVVHAQGGSGTGTITIKKQTQPPGGVDFEFKDNIPVGPLPFWYLDDGQEQPFGNVPAGTYRVTETDPAVKPGGYTLTKVVCVATNDPLWASYTLATTTVTIQFTDQTVECTFTNSRIPVGGLIVPVSKLGLLMPWLGLAALASLATVMLALLRRRRA